MHWISTSLKFRSRMGYLSHATIFCFRAVVGFLKFCLLPSLKAFVVFHLCLTAIQSAYVKLLSFCPLIIKSGRPSGSVMIASLYRLCKYDVKTHPCLINLSSSFSCVHHLFSMCMQVVYSK